MKEVHQKLGGEPRPEGTRKVPQPDRSQESTRPNRRHFSGSTVENSHEPHYDNRTSDTWERHHVQTRARVFGDDGVRAVEKPAAELSMEKNMGRKKRGIAVAIIVCTHH